VALALGAAPARAVPLNWNATSHDFGAVAVGSSSSQTFTLTAVCDAGIGGMPPELCATPPAGIHAFGVPAIVGGEFALGAPNTCSVGTLMTPVYPSMVSCQTAVTFTPASTGAKSGSLDLPTGPDVALTGTGAGAPAAPATTGKKKKCKKKNKKRSAAAAKKKCKKKKK
jgi:hypothetical protein